MTEFVNWTGASGAIYVTEINPIGVAYRPLPGIYIFAKHAATPGYWDGLYVGQTRDFDERLNTGLTQHHGWTSVVPYGATHICTLHVPEGLAERLRIETDLRHGLNCPCNKQ